MNEGIYRSCGVGKKPIALLNCRTLPAAADCPPVPGGVRFLGLKSDGSDWGRPPSPPILHKPSSYKADGGIDSKIHGGGCAPLSLLDVKELYLLLKVWCVSCAYPSHGTRPVAYPLFSKNWVLKLVEI